MLDKIKVLVLIKINLQSLTTWWTSWNHGIKWYVKQSRAWPLKLQALLKYRNIRQSEEETRFTHNQFPPARADTKRCTQCEQSNLEGRCEHCYKCSSSEHWAVGCRKRTITRVTSNKIEITSDLMENLPIDHLPEGPWSTKQKKTASLVGRRCMVQCSLGGVNTSVLWDTGSQVSIVETEWKKRHLPDAEVRPVRELLEEGELNLTAANGTSIPYEGWMEILAVWKHWNWRKRQTFAGTNSHHIQWIGETDNRL